MNILDIVIVLLLILSAVAGFKKGVIKELVTLIGVIIVYVVSFSLKGPLGLFLCKVFPFFELDGLITLNIIIYQMIAFVLIAGLLFSIYNIVLKLTGIIQKVIDISVILTLPSKLLGLVVGFIEGYIIMFILLLVLQIPLKDNALFANSKLVEPIVNNSFLLSSSLGNLDECIVDIINVTGAYKENEINDKNLEILELELKYNIISKKDLEEVIETGKLDEVEGINNLY